MHRPTRLVILFHRLGPYHWARLKAAARVFELTAIEQAAETAEYAWNKVSGDDGFERVTLFASGETANIQQTQMAARVQAALDRAEPEAVAIPGWSNPGGLAALVWALRNKVPVIVMSESTAGDRPRARWKEWPKTRIISLCSAAFAGGTPHRQYLEQLGMAAERIFLGYDAVDNAHFRHGADAARQDAGLRARLGLPGRYFLASNRFLPQKNLPVLLEAFAAYRATVGTDAWSLVLLGDGPGKPEILSRIDALGLRGQVTLPGFQQYEALPAYYGLAEAFVHTATSEPWGLVVNEPLAAGLPVIVSERCGCAADLVNPGNGFTFDPSNGRQLATFLVRLTNTPAPERATMGRAGQERIARWSVDRFADGMRAAVESARAVSRPRMGWLDRALLHFLTRGKPL